MCVIIIKEKGQKLPTKKMLQAAYQANPDGMGFCTSEGYRWRGLSFGEFWKQYREHVKQEDAVILHFRWATHGSVCETNCHPFKAEDADGAPIYFAHNGVLGIPSRNDKTDSEICFREKILPALENCRYEPNGFVKKYIERCTEGASRFALMMNGDITLFGHWCEYDGYKVSNTNFTYRLREDNYFGRWGLRKYA